MIFEFPQPCIIDTKNINSTFTKKKFVPKEFIPKIKKISKQRKTVKQTLKYITAPKIEEVPPYNLIDEIITYADSALELNSLFERDYIITKNWKWSPLLTQTLILKFSQSIKYGKSGEILMAQYAAFSACFRCVRSDINYIKQNLFLTNNQAAMFTDLTFSKLVQKDSKVTQLEEAIYKILKAQVKAWTLLKKFYNRSQPYFKNLASYNENYIESKAAGMEIVLLITKINTNMLYTEYLRLQGNYEEMGKYAKMIVTQAFLVEDRIKAHNFYVNPRLTEFVHICQKLYKAIALWSLFFTYLPKLRTNAFDVDEDFNILAGGCVAIVEEIARLHREILVLPNVKFSPLFTMFCLYFTDLLVAKSKEVNSQYSEVFKDCPYDEFHFNRMDELDYVSRTTGEEGY